MQVKVVSLVAIALIALSGVAGGCYLFTSLELSNAVTAFSAMTLFLAGILTALYSIVSHQQDLHKMMLTQHQAINGRMDRLILVERSDAVLGERDRVQQLPSNQSDL